ncbi:MULTISPECIES: quinol:cytochrome C oxidoreductase [Apibacter]|uniref:quinol:cytochrome C oxidoreductase n=1 Tax=Apibacter TaxID=1778601 RepID=UPI00132A0E52|nr:MULTISPECIES: quinol:cytochrome C oxidoreductase [Apibacter]MCX8676837.1 quinol:cytochrome C oxidoreductase [Apibacter sp. B3919]MXO24781.1 quinol:cytochrome C oxidoreductase [Apibacter sp. B3924]MXO26025.1 quinol:cytochrome C oxidoreductase [Apibacter sp. B3813]MXO27976.1 quinol:cytochrome C oxidoreductase [Apibacter sp. B3913]MXO29664.1 quinol:cytochrome C oxidoreductase [Apibacter sp. B3912]
MRYTFSSSLKLTSIVLIVVGLIAFGIGYYQNSRIDEHAVKEILHHNEELAGAQPMNSVYKGDVAHSKEHIEHAEHQIHNRPWSAFFVSLMLFFGISATALFFAAVQHAGNAGWSIVVIRVMEGIASFLPVGGLLMVVFIFLSSYGGEHGGLNHLYHWMDPSLTDPNSSHFDLLIKSKEPFLNRPFFVIRTLIYVAGCIFFLWKIKSLTRKLDETKDVSDYKKVYNWSVGAIVFFALASACWAWDWLMSIDPHWYSTLYMWYVLISCLVSSVGVMLIISIYLKKKGFLPAFNDNHMHDLAKFLFGFSLLWSYLWFAQFMLYWYADIPEETVYFFGRYKLYGPTYFTMLIPNLVLPFLILVSSKVKRNYVIVPIMACVVLFGHYLDMFNIIMPGTVGAFWGIGLLEIGAFIFMLGLFIFTVMYSISKLNLEAKGNPYYHESELFEYPF